MQFVMEFQTDISPAIPMIIKSPQKNNCTGSHIKHSKVLKKFRTDRDQQLTPKAKFHTKLNWKKKRSSMFR